MDKTEKLGKDDAPVLVIGGSGYLGSHLVLALLHFPKYSSKAIAEHSVLTANSWNLRTPQVTSNDISRLGSVEKARGMLGFEPLVTVDEGTRRAVEKVLEGVDMDRLVAGGKNVS